MPENGLSKGKAQPAKNGQKGKGKSTTGKNGQERARTGKKGKGKAGHGLILDQTHPSTKNSLAHSFARTHARTNETKRFPGWGRWRSNPPNLRYICMYVCTYIYIYMYVCMYVCM